MKIVGIGKIVSNQRPEEIMSFWDDFFTQNISDQIPNQISPSLFCLYTDYEGDYRDPYKMIIGHEVASFDNLSAGMEKREFDFEEYTHYTITGEMPKVVMNQWQEIWNNQLPRAYTLDFQRHNPDGSVDIFVEYTK
ncbi:MAG: hypothetical protein A2977_03685 [Alphaproteobacteria bacterium RIFCSPLOWO2_01_FULL_45_8]|nr:MAG: hypothetical protein A2065_02190 [Alphaproteobacteria bacterium GWB1_45_5]OFW89315.1 MAG: hypothetical protein A2621_00045 [Alphaproteobacteria bacterium RIFCSPHIGHO2_01_FULL_41_14]OFW95913.1 MAG: hypothetical protein A2977_03685 [Alphaproteobacteria bacterium RIFCSPLOWO2_01_FULL_45_8]